MSWFSKNKVSTSAGSTLRTVLPTTGPETKQPSPMINVVKLIDDTIPIQIQESEEMLVAYRSEVERLTSYIAGLKEVQGVWKKHDLVSLSKAGAKIAKVGEVK